MLFLIFVRFSVKFSPYFRVTFSKFLIKFCGNTRSSSKIYQRRGQKVRGAKIEKIRKYWFDFLIFVKLTLVTNMEKNASLHPSFVDRRAEFRQSWTPFFGRGAEEEDEEEGGGDTEMITGISLFRDTQDDPLPPSWTPLLKSEHENFIIRGLFALILCGNAFHRGRFNLINLKSREVGRTKILFSAGRNPFTRKLRVASFFLSASPYQPAFYTHTRPSFPIRRRNNKINRVRRQLLKEASWWWCGWVGKCCAYYWHWHRRRHRFGAAAAAAEAKDSLDSAYGK